MGLLLSDVRLLVRLQKDGASLGEMATLGRQWLLAEPADYGPVLRRSSVDPDHIAAFMSRSHKWADDLFRTMGATSVDVIDYSDYEGATFLHDLNRPIGEALARRFDCVYDGGTLEHVFNFPVAVANVMRMVRVGGYAILNNPMNNMCGHGFYQFSPELMYRVFSPENGFQVTHMFAAEQFRRGGKCDLYIVKDPESIGKRVQLDGGYPMNLYTVARKSADIVPFEQPPLQSDYRATWSAAVNAGADGTSRWYQRLRQRLMSVADGCFPKGVQALRNIRDPINNREYFLKDPSTSGRRFY